MTKNGNSKRSKNNPATSKLLSRSIVGQVLLKTPSTDIPPMTRTTVRRYRSVGIPIPARAALTAL
ncbi:hypothetical protein D3C81_1527570 [compost metagenome]